MTILQLWVDGIPVPKQSFIVSGRGRGRINPRVKAWQEIIAANVLARLLPNRPDPVDATTRYRVTLCFSLLRFRSGDCDNLSKAVLDALNNIVWKDDDQVDELHIHKKKDPTNLGVHIRIESVP